MANDIKIKLKWLCGYETLKFDTPDGDLDKNQYAINPNGGYFIRRHPKNNFNFVSVEKLDAIGMKRVKILEEKAYYNEFELPDKRTLRIPTTGEEYWKVGKVKDYPQPQKEVTDTEIKEITKDDKLWQ